MASGDGLLMRKALFIQELLAHVSIGLKELLIPENDVFQGVERSFGRNLDFFRLEKLFLTCFQVPFRPLGQWIRVQIAIKEIAPHVFYFKAQPSPALPRWP